MTQWLPNLTNKSLRGLAGQAQRSLHPRRTFCSLNLDKAAWRTARKRRLSYEQMLPCARTRTLHHPHLHRKHTGMRTSGSLEGDGAAQAGGGAPPGLELAQALPEGPPAHKLQHGGGAVMPHQHPIDGGDARVAQAGQQLSFLHAHAWLGWKWRCTVVA